MNIVEAKTVTVDDDLYGALYDVRREAEEAGNYIEGDPYPAMNGLRDQAPVHKGFLRQLMTLPPYHRHKGALERQGYTCFSFEACEQAFRDNVSYSNDVYQMTGGGDGSKFMGILEMDNPEHHAFRRAVQSLFIRPKAHKWWREHFIDGLVDDLVESLHRRAHDNGRAELNLQLCARVPVHTITRAVGLRGEDSLIFRNALVSASASDHGPATQEAARITVQRMLMEQIARRHVEPGEDILSWMLSAEIDHPTEGRRRLTDQEVAIFARVILLAGGGTTWRQLGIVLFALLTDPDQMDAVRGDRSLVDPAIEESLRWNPTNPMFTRLAVADTEFHGVNIPKGAILDICLGAANRDPRRWDNPDVFDLHRPFQQHLGTGIGAHMCLGRFVAQVEMGVTINRLFDAFPNLRLDPGQSMPVITGGLEQRGASALPVLLT